MIGSSADSDDQEVDEARQWLDQRARDLQAAADGWQRTPHFLRAALGDVHRLQGRFEEAVAAYQQAFDQYRTLGDRRAG